MKKLMVYSHDTFGLGNIRRMLSICKHLIDSIPDLSILIVSGSPMVHTFRIPQRLDYIKLPCLRRTDREGYSVKYLGTDMSELIRHFLFGPDVRLNKRTENPIYAALAKHNLCLNAEGRNDTQHQIR